MTSVPPSGPEGGERLDMTGSITVKREPDVAGLDVEFTLTITGPVPTGTELGTVATICEGLQLVTDAAVAPLIVIALDPCVVPKFEPAIVTGVPTVPTTGLTLETNGVVPWTTLTLSKVPVLR